MYAMHANVDAMQKLVPELVPNADDATEELVWQGAGGDAAA